MSKTEEKATPVQATPVQTEVKKSGGGGGKCFLIGCCAIIACCVLTFCGLGATVYFGGASILSSNKSADPSLTRLTTMAEVDIAIADAQSKTDPIVDPKTGSTTMTLTEKDILSMIIDGMAINSAPNKVGLKITPDSAKFEIDLGVIASAINESSSTSDSSSNVELKGFDNIFASISLGVGSDGKSIKVKEVSTGNGFIDSIFGSALTESFDQAIQENFTQELEKNGMKIEKVQLLSGKMIVTFILDQTTVPEYP